MKGSKKVLLVLTLAFFFASTIKSGLAFSYSNPLSEKVEGEQVTITLDFVSPREPTEKMAPAVVPIFAAGAAIAAEYGIKVLAANLDKEAKKYTAEYVGFVSDDEFYKRNDENKKDEPVESAENKDGNNNDEPAESGENPVFKYNQIKIIRKARLKSDEDPEIVSMIVLGLKLSSDRRFFMFEPESVKLDYAKAKLPKNDKDLDIDINISVSSIHRRSGS